MQPKFTLSRRFIFTFLTALAFWATTVSQVFAQTTTITATGSGGFGWANGYVTFNVENTNTYDIAITSVSSLPRIATGGSLTPSLWMSSTSLAGSPIPISSPDWSNVATGAVLSPTTTAVLTFLDNIYVVVPAGATRRFALVGASTTNAGIGYSGSTTTPNTFSSGGVNLTRGNAQIGGANVGYSGDFPSGTALFNPRFFTGSITFVQSTACSGTPAPGNTISSVTTVCAGTNFTLSLQNNFSASGITYQWQSSADGSTWTNVTGGTNATLSASLTAPTYYRCQVTCSGNTGTSSPVLVALTPASGCYCIPGATSCAFDDEILNVTLNTLNNSSSGCTAASGYTYYSSVAAPELYIGASNPMSVRVSNGGTERVAVWIDFNKNGVFDASEFTDFGSGNNVVISNNISVPANAQTGVTRMRVRTRWSTALTSTQACLGYTYGETEDYNVNLVPCVPASFTSQPANATVTCGGNATFTVNASGSLPAYSWQYRTSASGVWQSLPNGGIVSGATTRTLTLTDVPDSWNGYEIRSVLSGGCAGVNPSNAATLTVNRISTNTNINSASICSGQSQMLTLLNTVSTPQTVTFASTSGLPLTIPDANLTGVTNTIAVSGVPAGSVITNVAIKFTMTHTWVGDLIMNVKAPNGQTLNLVGLLNSGTGSNGTANFTNTIIDSVSTTALSGAAAPRTGSFRADKLTFSPNCPLIQPNTTSSWLPLFGTPNGNWTIAMCDAGNGDIGVLTAWSIEVTYVAPVYAQGTWTATPATPNTIFTDAALTTQYTGGLATTVYVNPTVNTSYTVSFTTSTTPCASAPKTVPFAVGVPITGLTAPATVATCVGSGFSITASHASVPSTNATPSYQWQVSADGGVSWSNISGATTTTLSVASTTQSMNGRRYRVLVTSGGCAVVGSTPTVLTVNALPTVTLSAASTTLTPGQSTTVTGASSPAAAANGWTWSLNGATIAGTTNSQVVNIDGLGSYQATVRDVNGCVNSSNTVTLTAEASDKLWIYPNPTAGAFQIRYYHAGDANEKRIISVYNAAGQLVASKSFDLTYTSAPYLRMDVDLSGAARGTYVVKVAHEYSGKIVSGLVLVQ